MMDIGDKVHRKGEWGTYEILARTTDGRPIVGRILHDEDVFPRGEQHIAEETQLIPVERPLV